MFVCVGVEAVARWDFESGLIIVWVLGFLMLGECESCRPIKGSGRWRNRPMSIESRRHVTSRCFNASVVREVNDTLRMLLPPDM